LRHAGSKMLIVDIEFLPLARAALNDSHSQIELVVIEDPSIVADVSQLLTYETLIESGDAAFDPLMPADEWDAIALNYTSGTTGDPKGVVYHHRGAYLNAVSNTLAWGLGEHPVYLWTLPLFHCNGWCFPWTITALAGTHVCLRRLDAGAVYDAIEHDGVTHLCGAPVVMNMLLNAGTELKRSLGGPIEMMTAGAAPPAAVIEGMENLGFRITHVYGL